MRGGTHASRTRSAGPAALVLAAVGLLIAIGSKGAVEARQGYLVPVAASSVARFPETYIGMSVTMTGAVERTLSETAFSVDQDAAARTDEVLVLAPTLTGPVDLNTYITVQGRVVRFTPAEVERWFPGYASGLSPDVVAAFDGRPAVLATAVISAELVDLAKVPPPPMSAAEVAFDQVMKRVSPAMTALRAGVQAEDAEEASAQAAELKAAFGEVERFFADRETEDAVAWAQEAVGLVEFVERAIAGGYWDVASATAGNVNRLCQRCHAAHRVQLDDGSYRVRFDG